ESVKICGVWTAPAQSTTRRARTSVMFPALSSTSTPTAELASKMTRRHRVRERIVRFGRCRAVARYVVRLLARSSPMRFRGTGPTPVEPFAFIAGQYGGPLAMQDSTNAWTAGAHCWRDAREIGIGPDSP